MAKRKDTERVSFWWVDVDLMVHGALSASSPSSEEGIKRMLAHQPTEAQLTAREAAGEVIRDIPELAAEAREGIEEVAPNTVWRRDKYGIAYIHPNYIKGHIRECGDACSRLMGFWGLEAFITKTVTPVHRIYLDHFSIGVLETKFAPKVRLSSGVEVRQSTIKTEEFVESPVLPFSLLILADPRWTWDLLNDLLFYGGTIRGIGPGRGRCESKYSFKLGELEKVLDPSAIQAAVAMGLLRTSALTLDEYKAQGSPQRKP